MKTIKQIIAALILINVFTACKKEVQIDLQSKESRVVIEADFSADKKVNNVYVTKTKNVYSTESFPEVTGAHVLITDNGEYREVLTETRPGVYQTRSFPGKVGVTYFLKVVYENKVYEAKSTVPAVVKLDTAIVVTSNFGDMKMWGFAPIYTDPAGVRNNYRFVQYVNGERVKGSIQYNDEFIDGQVYQLPLYIMDVTLKSGDSLAVEMQMIDDAAYKYFSSKEQTADLESAAPANPVTNLSGGALGYFSVHSTQYAKMVVTN